MLGSAAADNAGVPQPANDNAQLELRVVSREIAEARALAPAYDYIRALVTKWAAVRAEREQDSGREGQAPQR